MKAIALGILFGLVPAIAWAVDVESPAALVDALHSAFGKHQARAVHAKGIVLEGRFTPTAEAAALSRAVLFAGPATPVTVRFSDFTGLPDIPDTADGANPRGFAMKFTLPDGGDTDIVTHGFNGFPTATADEFAVLLRSIGASGPGAAKPTALDNFLAGHPVALKFLTTQKPAPASYATLPYYGVNTFAFIDKQGRRTPVRYRFIPGAGEQLLDPAVLKAKGPNYLAEEIRVRVAAAPVRFDWFAQVAAPGDVLENPSIAWPDDRKLVKLGTLEIVRVAIDQAAADKAVFLPGNLPSGIEAVDPMIGSRQAAYPISAAERGAGKSGMRETATPLFRHTLPNAPGKVLISVAVDYPPGGKSLPHHHAKSAFIYAYVVSGAIRSQVDDQSAKVYQAGESFFETPGAHHRISENASDTEPARLLAVFVLDPDETLTIPDRQ
jgi:catalase